MEYVYTALLLNSTGAKINEASVKKVLTAAGVKTDESRIKALVAALDGVDIKEAISKAAPAVSAVAQAPVAEEKKEAVKEEKEEKVSEQEAAAGLGALFG